MVKRSKTKTINHIPEEIIHEILINLPVKPLLRFKCVSKPWRRLISSKSFTKTHLQESSIDRHNLMYDSFEQRQWSLRTCSLKCLLDGPKSRFEMVPSRNHGSIGTCCFSSITKILGSCNGLLLIDVNDGDLFVWNPSTRLFKYILPSEFSHDTDPCLLLYGFGYDYSTDDYKIVCIFFLETHPTEIYSLRSDSWKQIQNFKMGDPILDSGQFVNGKLHWMMWHSGRWECVALDLAKEEYEIVDGPHQFLNYDCWQWSVLNLGGYLGMVCVDNGCSNRDVWVMIKYGDAESWTRIWRQSEHLSPGRNKVFIRWPIWFRENEGDVVVHFDKFIEVYDIRNKSLKFRTYSNLNVPISNNWYVESLVSPYGND